MGGDSVEERFGTVIIEFIAIIKYTLLIDAIDCPLRSRKRVIWCSDVIYLFHDAEDRAIMFTENRFGRDISRGRRHWVAR
jgi:hypothetical protein